MSEIKHPPIAIVGVGAMLPDAPDASQFWENIKNGRYSIAEVPNDRWDPDLFYDPDPKAPAKTYSKIGGWVQDWEWNPIGWRLPIPPKVADAMDLAQKWAVAGTRQALADYGYPERPLDTERTAVIIGNAMAGDQHYLTAIRVFLPEYELELARAESFAQLAPEVQNAIRREFGDRIAAHFPEITEDSMPGELGNIIAGRVANLFDFHGPNFVTDAACASAMAAIGAAIEGLEQHDFDAVITGGVDSNMSASTFTKFCKIGALSATGTRPYAEGADGFVMGEGAALFVLKRLEDAVRDEDQIYALIRGVGGSSDGRGKGITAPNPKGQRLAVERAWQRVGLVPDGSTLIEGHGTSTRVGDVVEVESLTEAFQPFALPVGRIPLGSVKSNIGHLKGAAGAAGLLKSAFALRDRLLPPSLGCETPNPKIDFDACPFFVNTELRDWEIGDGDVRRAAVSAFGFGGTNFHVVLEEYRPGKSLAETRSTVSVSGPPLGGRTPATLKAPLRGTLIIGAVSEAGLGSSLQQVLEGIKAGGAPKSRPPTDRDLAAPHRLIIDYGDVDQLTKKATKALTILESGRPEAWRPLRGRGVFYGQGPATKVAMLFTGQGSQYLNMLREMRDVEPVVAETFDEADAVMTPLLGRPLTDHLFIDETDSAAVAAAEEKLRQTAITQPAVLTVDIALTRLLAAYGVHPDFVMGHSLGEYGALVAGGAMDFADALAAVSARGEAMMKLAADDNGGMAAVFAPLEDIEKVLDTIDGYVVVANINSPSEAVIGGGSEAVAAAVTALNQAGFDAKPLPVSHAFHTAIVAPVSGPLRTVLEAMDLRPPELPIVANVTGEFYPMGPGVEPEMVDILARQVARPVQFVKGLESLYRAGARVFVEVGPKRALQGMVRGVFEKKEDVLALSTNHPRLGDLASFNQALCGLWGAGIGTPSDRPVNIPAVPEQITMPTESHRLERPAAVPVVPEPASALADNGDTYLQLGKMFADVLERGMELYSGERPRAPEAPVVITGASLGLPGTERVFDDRNAEKLLTGQQFIRPIPAEIRSAMVDKNITRLVKSEQGGPHFETIDDTADVIKLAARAGEIDLVEEFGYPVDRDAALDLVTKLAIGSGLDALRDAGIPLVRSYKTTTKGTQLPGSWRLPRDLRDDTGVIFASAFPGVDFFASETKRFYHDQSRRRWMEELEDLRDRVSAGGGGKAVEEIDGRLATLRAELEADPYTFERRFLFKLLSMGHSQFAELIGARGPNTQINAACASGTQAVGLAEDWIRAGRCRRVVVISADAVTSDEVLEWIGAGFLASGAAATDEHVEDAAIPFDRRRHGMIIGMGAAAMVVESREAATERGLQPICDVLSTVTANSAFHGTRLDVEHISQVMEGLIEQAEAKWGLDRQALAPETVFISHETYTPARGGSAQAEIFALRHVFGAAADSIVIANTKGYTGHPMAVAMEDVLAVKALETGLVPPVANIKEIDPELGDLNLSRGGIYPVRYALRLGAGFGSQISMSLLRLEPFVQGRRPGLDELGFAFRVADPNRWQEWLNGISGYPTANLEVSQRTLRIRDEGPPAVGEPMKKTVSPPIAAEPLKRQAPVPAVPAPIPAAEMLPTTPIASAGLERPPSAGVAAEGDRVTSRILELVAELTGYPEDMLDLDLDMEADLGIDTVKQAEMFAAIRGEWDIPRDDNLQLRDFPTLADAIRFVYERRPDLLQSTGASSVAVETTPIASAGLERPPSAGVAAEGDRVTSRILELVAELTGYPEDMLDLDLDMEADLGIDTVKQAEMFAAIRGEWDIPRDDNLQLRDFPTLADAIQFVYERRPDLHPDVPATEPGPDDAMAEDDPGTAGTEAGRFKAEMGTGASSVHVPRRVPTAVLRPPIAMCKPTSVGKLAGRRVVVMPDEGGVGVSLARKLDGLGAEVLLVEGVPDDERLRQLLETWMGEGGVDGVYWLPGLDPVGPIAELSAKEWSQAINQRVKLMHTAMQTLFESYGEERKFLVSATRMGGRHGYDSLGALSPLGGAVAGFTKTFKRERPEATVKVVDFERGAGSSWTADALIEETLQDPGIVEVGYCDDQRWTVGLMEKPIEETDSEVSLGEKPVFVVTGAAGSIVSAIVGDLAGRWPGHFYLLDLTSEPSADDPDLALFRTDRDALKRTLFERLKEQGEKATPAAVEKQLAAFERSQAALSALDAVAEAGGQGHYRSLNLLDQDVVAEVIEEIGQEHGRIDVLVHAAGIEISHMLPNKTREEFDLIFDVKAQGWFHLMKAARDIPVGAIVVFTSIAGRFGNAGQTDYSSANDLLCKLTSNLRSTRPETRGIAIDWTAWADIGMATRGSIPKMMKQAGIDMVPPQIGIPIVAREILFGPGEEIVVAGALGGLLEDFDSTGGLDPAALEQNLSGPMATTVVGFGLYEGLIVEAELDPTAQPFLLDHQIDGTAVLPGVMGIEAFTEVAQAVLPAWSVIGVEDMEFLAPFKFYRDEPRVVRVQAVFGGNANERWAACRLIGRRSLLGGERQEETLHFAGTVRLAREPRAAESRTIPPDSTDTTLNPDLIYAVYFHGPAYQVLDEAWRSGDQLVARMTVELPVHHLPENQQTIAGPRLIELCFQAAGLLDFAESERVGLPNRLATLELYQPTSETTGARVVVEKREDGTHQAVVVADSGRVLLAIEGYSTIELPLNIDSESLAVLRQLVSGSEAKMQD